MDSTQASDIDEALENPTLHVLLIEEDPLLRWAIVQTLRRAGHTIVEAADATAAGHVLRSATPPVNLVLFDGDTIGWRGIGPLIAAAGRTDLDAVSVMITGARLVDGRSTTDAIEVGAVITKPFDMDALAGFLVAVWQRARVRDPAAEGRSTPFDVTARTGR